MTTLDLLWFVIIVIAKLSSVNVGNPMFVDSNWRTLHILTNPNSNKREFYVIKISFKFIKTDHCSNKFVRYYRMQILCFTEILQNA